MIPWLISTALAGTPLQEHMQGHFEAATSTLTFATLGNLEQMKVEAAKLEHARPDEVPAELEAYVVALQAAAKAVGSAPDLASASAATASLGLRCAACHTASAAGLEPEEEQVLFPTMSMLDDTEKHAWASYMMWIGLVVPDSRAWTLGVADLQPPAASPPTEAAVGPLSRFATTAAAARKAETGEERAVVLGAFAASCASCHATMGITVTP